MTFLSPQRRHEKNQHQQNAKIFTSALDYVLSVHYLDDAKKKNPSKMFYDKKWIKRKKQLTNT